ncbi:uncharacterized protein PHACADRAFT_141281 [Phanerochaete carnosa HHB-10118-sp]|uniref:YjgF-like protein n=1 Tax=Phanerochaete carnosa (strain HHB-10118-sp) TaxID=650164 RepID=K5VY79_PHACS|nr:uncharacterized protein PHACADRAFT_141281 [Phanerochaete carnosa HHB-10118-sp]EKM56533.1 hypothetical protein PHACADRAFT_141281 [Phanerochaete carnosa HHB-10118-sp]
MPQFVHTSDALPVFPVFSQATISKGMVYVSGNIGCNRDLKTLVEGGVQAQTRAALENMAKVLKAAGSGLEHIVKANIYLADMANFGPMNEVYAQFFDPNAMPARTCIGVMALPLGADVEIECIAEIPGQ